MEYSRRQFFRRMVTPGPGKWDDEEEGRACIRPPGALASEEAFLAACNACGDCEAACPHGAIRPLGLDAGRAEGTPHVDVFDAPCRFCPDMPCIAACERRALVLPSDGVFSPMMKVDLDLELCLTSKGILCDDCATVCPPSAHAIRMVNRKPVLDPDACVGCGMCVYHCDASPKAIEVARVGSGS